MEKSMSAFTVHTTATAPAAARPLLESARSKLGFVPNLYGGLAESPATLAAYFQLSDLLAESAFTPAEQQVLALAISATNGCGYCMAAHSTIARHVVKLDSATVDALREQRQVPDARLEALRRFTAAVVRERGWVHGQPLEDFLGAGYSRQHVLEVILAVAMKTLSNYANHVLGTPVDEQFAPEAWQIDGEQGRAAGGRGHG
jgi:uncharacterized peroxidase-related enzyme